LKSDDPIAGKRIFAKSPFRMTKVKDIPVKTAPDLGEHTDAILKDWLHYDDTALAQLRGDAVI